jgi:hypothetical protein
MFFRLSASARQAVSSEFSDPTDCADAIATDCPIRATHSMSGRFFGPLFDSRAWTQAIVFASPFAWSTLLITPTVLVPTVTVNENTSVISYYNKILMNYRGYFQIRHRPSESISLANLKARDDATSAACIAGMTTSSIASLCPAYSLI